tara:strand:- start:247 stop:408 length:162 start_codon:yes stop_codon:yes gene_type:complete
LVKKRLQVIKGGIWQVEMIAQPKFVNGLTISVSGLTKISNYQIKTDFIQNPLE